MICQEVCGIISDQSIADTDPPTSGLPQQMYLTTNNLVRYYDSDISLWRIVKCTPIFVFRDTRNAGIWLINTTNGFSRNRIHTANQLGDAIAKKYIIGKYNEHTPQNLLEDDVRTFTMNVGTDEVPLDPQPPLDAQTDSQIVYMENQQWMVDGDQVIGLDRTATFVYYDNGAKITLQYIFQKDEIQKGHFSATLDVTLSAAGDIQGTDWSNVEDSTNVFLSNDDIYLSTGNYKFNLQFNYTTGTLVDDALGIPYIRVHQSVGNIDNMYSFPVVNFTADDNTQVYGPLQKSKISASLIIQVTDNNTRLTIGYDPNGFTQDVQTSIGSVLTTLSIEQI